MSWDNSQRLFLVAIAIFRLNHARTPHRISCPPCPARYASWKPHATRDTRQIALLMNATCASKALTAWGSSQRPSNIRPLDPDHLSASIYPCFQAPIRCAARAVALIATQDSDFERTESSFAASRGDTKTQKTHKSLNGNSFATPPRTMNTATAKLIMRLKITLFVSLTTSLPKATA